MSKYPNSILRNFHIRTAYSNLAKKKYCKQQLDPDKKLNFEQADSLWIKFEHDRNYNQNNTMERKFYLKY